MEKLYSQLQGNQIKENKSQANNGLPKPDIQISPPQTPNEICKNEVIK